VASKRPAMPDSRLDDRAWTDAIDRYAARAGSARSRRRGAQGRWVLASAVVLAVAVSPFAVAATGSAILEGKRNPTSGASSKETQLISKSKTYGTRQSNVRNGNGGGAIYGCRSKSGREPCIRSNNLSTGRAFEFETDGGEAGRILSKSTSARPFSTNATGVASGLNADRVDNFDVARIDFKASPGTAQTDVLNMGGLILRASCGNGPDLALVATTTVPDSTLHIGWNKDPGNLSFYRQENDLDPGETFTVITNPNDDSVEGTISYSTPAGAQVSITFQSEEGNAFGNTVPCFLGGTALGG
jgi:hypothetical protein